MWDEKHLQFLRQGPQVWNKWRQSNVDIAPELTGIALALNERRWGPEQGGPINFKQAKLGSVNLSYAALPGANFEFAILDQCDLTGSRLVGAKFRGASLRGVHFAAADLQHADFTDADLRGADFRGALHLHAGQIQGARGDLNTQLPEYIVPPINWRSTERPGSKMASGPIRQNTQPASDIPNVTAKSVPRKKSISMVAIAAAGLVVIGGVVAVQFVLNREPPKTQQANSEATETASSVSRSGRDATSQSSFTKSSEAAAWAFVQRNPTHDILHDYLVTFPHGLHAREVQQQYNRLEAAKARQRAQIAEARADAAAWEIAKLDPTHNNLHNYLVKHPHGKYAAQAQVQYDLLEQKEAQQRAFVSQSRADVTAWEKVRSNPTRKALETYLSNYGSGEFAGAAKEQIAQLNKKAARAGNGASGERLTTGTIRRRKDPIANKLLSIRRDAAGGLPKAQPIPAFKGPIAAETALQLQRGTGKKTAGDSAGEQAEWRKIQAQPSRYGLRDFVVKYPKSKNIEIAQFLLAALNAEYEKRNTEAVKKAKVRILAIIRDNKKREKAEWTRVQKNPTIEVLHEFIAANPKSKYLKIAKLQLSALRAAFPPNPTVRKPRPPAKGPGKVQARLKTTVSAPVAPVAPVALAPAPVAVASAPITQQEQEDDAESRAFALAKARILSFARKSARQDKIAWKKVLKSPSQKSLRTYLFNLPHGDHAAQARLMIKELQVRRTRQKADRAAWIKVKKRPTRKALRSYLVTFKDGKFVSAAKKKLAALRSKTTRRRAKKKAAVATKARSNNKTY